ncbi:hypothetical protein Sjap_016397 [Stephania japonica]|uniref:Uncharacterized protein n=1 Tax=Stephania japonica TaxID=461633 RepID=A0AAP0ILV3_9MAGN
MEPRSAEQEGKPYTVLFTTNLRKRRVPTLHDHSFGNMYSFVNEVFTNEEESKGFVGRIKSAVRRINGEFVGKIESDGDWYSKHIEDEAMKSIVEGMRNINFSSWCRFDFYNADFGWGRPVWTSIVTMPYENSVFLLDTKGLDGIEAWVSMSEENMAEFASDAELLHKNQTIISNSSSPQTLQAISPRPTSSTILRSYRSFYTANADHQHHRNGTSSNDVADNASQQLQSSLSETLTHFYPLAGRIKDHLVDCNDEGINYFEASASIHLSDFLLRPKVELILNQFLPLDAYNTTSSEQIPLAAVQVSYFKCGGMAIGVCVAHMIADGSTVAMFLNSWAAAFRNKSSSGEEAIIVPWLSSASLFPPKDLPVISLSGLKMNEKVVTRRFLFDAPKMAALRTQLITKNGITENKPTRVEAVTALIWKYAKNIKRVKSRSKGVSLATHAVNLRKRTTPTTKIPENSFGNLWCSTAAEAITEESEEAELNSLASQIKMAIRKIDCVYVKRLQSEADSLTGLNCLRAVGKNMKINKATDKDEMEVYRFSSWCRLPFYEPDFVGWGRPVWVSTSSVPLKNIVILMSTRDGAGIEAWVTLEEEDMNELLAYKELLMFIVP